MDCWNGNLAAGNAGIGGGYQQAQQFGGEGSAPSSSSSLYGGEPQIGFPYGNGAGAAGGGGYGSEYGSSNYKNLNNNPYMGGRSSAYGQSPMPYGGTWTGEVGVCTRLNKTVQVIPIAFFAQFCLSPNFKPISFNLYTLPFLAIQNV